MAMMAERRKKWGSEKGGGRRSCVRLLYFGNVNLRVIWSVELVGISGISGIRSLFLGWDYSHREDAAGARYLVKQTAETCARFVGSATTPLVEPKGNY